MTSAAEQLGSILAAAGSGARERTISAQVVDVTTSGTVNLDINGTLILDVPCATSYTNRAAGQWVAVRLSAGRAVVQWQLGADPADDPAGMRRVVEEAQVVRAVTWGTAAPAGEGWQQATVPWVRQAGDGQVELYYQVTSTSAPSPAAPGTKPVTVSPTESGSWRNGRPDSYAAYPMQGDWTGGGNRRGAWFYGTRIADACRGKTVAGMQVTLSRRTGSGVNAARPVHLYLHSYTTAPAGQLALGDGPEELMALSAGAERTAALPFSWVTALASGAARGLAVYAQGSADYMALSNGRIKITFSA